jgi:polysaccharide export outer membrane protein
MVFRLTGAFASWTLCLLAVSILLLGGCQSGMVRAHRLSAELRVPPAHSAKQVDLTNLARAATRNELIYPGDVLEVDVSAGVEGERNTSKLVRVTEQGTINVPIVGQVSVAGLELTQAERAIYDASRERRIYRNPQVSVFVKHRRSNRVTVMGAVSKPGTYELPASGSDLLAALVASGGLTEDADTLVEIRSPVHTPGPVAGDLDNRGYPVSPAGYLAGLPADVAGGSQRVDLTTAHISDGRDYRVRDGSVVMVMERPERSVQVMGLVKKPGQFEIPDGRDLRLLDALSMAGGLRTDFANEVRIARHVPGREQVMVIEAKVSRAKSDALENLRLAPGDVVSVEPTPLTFVMEELQKYVRIGVSATSRLAF